MSRKNNVYEAHIRELRVAYEAEIREIEKEALRKMTEAKDRYEEEKMRYERVHSDYKSTMKFGMN